MFILYISRKSVLYVLLLSLFFFVVVLFALPAPSQRCELNYSAMRRANTAFMVPDFRHMDHLLN